MSTRPKAKIAVRKPRKSLVEIIEAHQPYDATKAERTRRRAIDAADKLLRDMDQFVRTAGRKP